MNDDSFSASIQAVASAMKDARRVLFLTGAGLSAESGLPTYRGVGGLYNGISVEEGLPIEEVLSGAMFIRSPTVTWRYIAEIEAACRGARANEAHRVIAALESRFEVCVITQNVDGFHHDAGSTNVIEMHGNLHRLHCVSCGHAFELETYAELEIPPRCSQCDGLVRPEVVLFGEMLGDDARQRYERETTQGFDVVLAVGTTAGFPYIQAPVFEAVRRRTPTVEINPDETALSDIVRYRIPTGARAALKALMAALEPTA